ncbi:MAG: LysR family transcriptional regulator [Paracoccus sp. BP8]|nr:MAG: LysR family transcriptional regulator [Paracoccus sp. BP8]
MPSARSGAARTGGAAARPAPSGRAKARRLRLARISPRRVGKKLCRALDPPLVELSPRLRLTASHAQLIALIRVCEFENFTLAARSLELSQPTVHRAISQLEQEAGRPLFQRTPFGLVASRAARDLAQAARLAFHELEQAVGKIVIGALPMSRSVLLPGALAAFRRRRAIQPVHVVDAFFMDAGVAPANSIIEAGSILLMREMLTKGDFLGCISALQAAAEIRHGLIRRPDVPARWTPRPIGCASPTAGRVRCVRSGATTSVS